MVPDCFLAPWSLLGGSLGFKGPWLPGGDPLAPAGTGEAGTTGYN